MSEPTITRFSSTRTNPALLMMNEDSEMKICPECEAEILKSLETCPRCGHKF